MTALPTTTCYQGDTVALDFLLLDESGNPEDLDELDLRWAMSARDELDVPILQKDSDSGITVLDATGGRCRVIVAAGDLATAGTFLHEIEGTTGTGSTYTYGQGLLIVKPTIYPTA